MKIAQVGTFDLDNLGDLLFPWVTKRLFNLLLGDDIVYDCYSPTCSQLIYPDQLPHSALTAFHQQDLLKNYDLILIGGGDLIRDDDYSLYPVYGDKSPALTFSNILSPTSTQQRRFALLAVGLPYDVAIDFGLFLKNSFARVQRLSVRDERSASYLQPYVNQSIDIVPDFVHAIPFFLDAKQCAALIKNLIPAAESGYLCFQGHADVCIPAKEAAKTLQTVERETGKAFVLIEIGGCLGDTEYLTQLSEITGYPLVSRDNFPNITLEEKVAVIACSSGFIGSSLHGNIISNAYGIYNISYVGDYSHKITKYFESEGHGLLFRDFNELNASMDKVIAEISGSRSEKFPLADGKYRLISDFVKGLLNSVDAPIGNVGAYSSEVDQVYKTTHAKSCSREHIVSHQLRSIELALAAEKENAVAQITYRDKLIEELEDIIDAERANASLQIRHRDQVIEELNQAVAKSKKKRWWSRQGSSNN